MRYFIALCGAHGRKGMISVLKVAKAQILSFPLFFPNGKLWSTAKAASASW